MDVNKILDVCIALAKEKNHDQLLNEIVETAMELTNCDAGTLYLLKDEKLEFYIMHTKSQGVTHTGKRQPVKLPPVELRRENVCACAVMEKRLINVPDILKDQDYDFSGAKRYDAMTGYCTKSMMAVPMENDVGEVIGVVQLINAMDESGNVVAFEKEYERVLQALASQAAISLTNMGHRRDIIYLLDSFVRAMSTAINARSAYNANHTKNMVEYGERFIKWLNKHCTDWTFSPEEAHQFLMAVWLHDVGKLVIPLEVMDKNTRLGERVYDVKKRLKIVELLNRIAFLEGRVSAAEYEEKEKLVANVLALVKRVNQPGPISDEDWKMVQMLGTLTYQDTDGRQRPWFIPEELEAMNVQRGTLTPRERVVMESHVTETRKILAEVKFSEHYKNVPKWASAHHELLNGSGYPDGLKADEIPREVRLITILDIFEALTAKDRPYRAAMPLEKSMAILESMVKDGLLDGKILKLFQDSQVWKEDWDEME